jgi:hypothetical protein
MLRGTAHRIGSCWLALALGVACGLERVELRGSADDPRGDAGADTPDSPDAPRSGESAPSGADVATGTSGFDVPTALAEPGCTKVDFLFVIDNSLSMLLAQRKLDRSFPGFMRVVEGDVAASDFHIMVVDTDSWDGTGGSASADGCREVLGAGRRSDASGNDCGVVGDARYIASPTADLTETFSCLADVGTFGDPNEQPIDAVLQALSPAQNAAGGCNAGFLRNDAILVVTLITNQDDDASSGTPETWRENLLALKGGDPSALVVLGFVGDNNVDGGLDGGPCSPLLDFGTSGAPKLQQLLQGLDRGAAASVCADDYTPFFEQAVTDISTACEQFVPR